MYHAGACCELLQGTWRPLGTARYARNGKRFVHFCHFLISEYQTLGAAFQVGLDYAVIKSTVEHDISQPFNSALHETHPSQPAFASRLTASTRLLADHGLCADPARDHSVAGGRRSYACRNRPCFPRRTRPASETSGRESVQFRVHVNNKRTTG